jgi:hypothetical protein
VGGTLEAGASLGTWGELRIGLRRAQTDYTTETGTVLLPQFRNVNSAGHTSTFLFDRRDSPFVPTRGGHKAAYLQLGRPLRER